MEIDGLTKKGKGGNGNVKLGKGADGRTSCSACGRAGHMAEDSWFRGRSKGGNWNREMSKGKGERDKCGVSELKILSRVNNQSINSIFIGILSSRISRTTQRNDDFEYEEPEAGYIFAAIRSIAGHDTRKRWNRETGWNVAHVLVDNSADEHVCSL